MTDPTMTQYELRYQSLVDGRGYAFPCDPEGRVDLDQLSDRARNDYLFARLGGPRHGRPGRGHLPYVLMRIRTALQRLPQSDRR